MQWQWSTHWLAVLRPIQLLGFGIDESEPSDGFVSLLAAHVAGDLQQFLWCVRREEAPSFVAAC